MEESFRIVNTLADAVGSISSIRFSPDGNRMAAASLDGSVYIYSVLENFKLEVIKVRWRAHQAYVLASVAW